VRLIEATGQQYTHAESYVPAVEQRLQEQAREQQRIRETVKRYEMPHELKSIDEYRNRPEYHGDLHRADLAWTIYALSHGASESEVTASIASRDLSKKGGLSQQEQYVQRTIEAAQRRIGANAMAVSRI
jgi:acetoin utilization deacetylase AcuC-like enzyme